MKRQTWRRKIKQHCEDAGTYRPFFDPVIDTLAGILETRDEAEKQFIDSGGRTVTKHTNKGGASNMVKNPALVVVMECNAQALQYWQQLGLTSKAYKQLFADMRPPDGKSSFEDILSGLGV